MMNVYFCVGCTMGYEGLRRDSKCGLIVLVVLTSCLDKQKVLNAAFT